MLVVVFYDRKYNCIWQIIRRDGTVVHEFKTRKEALTFLEELNGTCI